MAQNDELKCLQDPIIIIEPDKLISFAIKGKNISQRCIKQERHCTGTIAQNPLTTIPTENGHNE